MKEKRPIGFLGLTVEGNADWHERAEQRPLSELEPLLKAVLDDPNVRSFAWTQYTPAFNDGDPCVFRVRGLSFRAAEPGDEPSEDFDSDDSDYEYAVGSSRHPDQHPDLVDVDTLARCRALAEEIDTGAFDRALYDAFGDGVEVIVKPTGITLNEYSPGY